MRTQILSDLSAMKKLLAMMLVICVATAVATTISGGHLMLIGPCFIVTTSMMFLLFIFSYDEMNGWQTFRLTMPLSRKDIVMGRYISVLSVMILSACAAFVVACFMVAAVSSGVADGLLNSSVRNDLAFNESTFHKIWQGIAGGSMMALFMTAVMLPFFMRFGAGKGMRRLAVVAAVFFIPISMLSAADGPLAPAIGRAIRWVVQSGVSVFSFITLVLLIMLAINVLSMLVTIRLYEGREF